MTLPSGGGRVWELGGALPHFILLCFEFCMICLCHPIKQINHVKMQIRSLHLPRHGTWTGRHRSEAGRPPEEVLGVRWGGDGDSKHGVAVQTEKEMDSRHVRRWKTDGLGGGC